MAIDLDEPIMLIEHDHTRLHVQLEDLEAIARHGFSATDKELLEEARHSLEELRRDVSRHFKLEENGIFAQITRTHIHLRTEVETLVQQHRQLHTALSRLSELLEGSCEEVAGRQEIFDTRWKEMHRLWNRHSRIEWEMLLLLRQPMCDKE